MGRIISFANQKGGVGKTTTCVYMSAFMALMGKKVLMIDLDPQGNATSNLGFSKDGKFNSIYQVLSDEVSVENAIYETKIKNLSLIPSNIHLAGVEVELVYMNSREFVIKNILDKIKDSYDYITIDCPPSLELLTLNALCAADAILVPVQCEYFALEGLSDLMATLRMVKRKINPRLEIFGVALTMFDGRTNFSTQVAQEVRRHFPGKVFSTVIPRNIRLSEAPSHGVPVLGYDRSSKGAKAYKEMADEMKAKL